MHFYAENSFFWVLPIAIFAFGVSLFLYNKQTWLEELSFKGWKWILVTLRFITITILFLLLLDIFVEKNEKDVQKPIIIGLIDNSTSIKNYKDSLKVKTEIQKLLNQYELSFKNDYDLRFYTIGDSLKFGQELDLKDPLTNISEAIENVYDMYNGSNLGAVILISDGNYNQGMNPFYSINRFVNTPFYTVGIGDSLVKKDLFIKSVSLNKVAYLDDKFPVEIEVGANKFSNHSAFVRVYESSELLAEKKIKIGNLEESFQKNVFLLDAKKVGLNQFRVVIENAQQEYTYKNNSRLFQIEVVEKKNKILFVSDAPHPDISALRSVLENEQQNDVEVINSSDWLNRNDDVSLVICHEPGLLYNNVFLKKIKQTNQPILWMAGLQSGADVLNKLNLGFNFNLRYQTEEAQSTLNSNFELFELSHELKTLIPNLPPLTIRFGQIKSGGKNTILLKQNIGGVVKEEPIISFVNNGNHKVCFIYGEGLWKWKMTDYVLNESHESFNELFSKITNYLIVQNDDSPLKIIIPEQVTSQDELVVKATFYNASNKLINKPKLNFSCKYDGVTNNLEFDKNDDFYSLNLGNLRPGKYTWSCKLEYNGKDFFKNGEFIVEELTVEDLDSRTNKDLLLQIASKSKGVFYWLKNGEKVIENIKNESSVVSIFNDRIKINPLIDFYWLFICLIISVSLEWFLRRFLGSY